MRELVHGDRRIKYPMKLVDGQWQRISWDVAINEIGDKMMQIRAKSGADSVYMLGSAKFSNEGAYLFRKFAAFWGTNNVDHQARICHSTTVAGVANTWGYGAMTNSYNDIRNSKTILFMGSNAAEAHPVSMQHILVGKEQNRANVIVFDPRLTRTAAHATDYIRIRSGTDIAVIWGMMWHIFKNGWEDKAFLAARVHGMDDVRKEVEKYDPKTVEDITGVPEAQLKRAAETFAKVKPATFIWCMGVTQHSVGTANVRAICNLLLATGNVGGMGNGANIFRGHCNVQGATDFGLDICEPALLLRAGRGRLAPLGPRLGRAVRLLRHPLRRSAGQGRPSGADPQGQYGDLGPHLDPLVRRRQSAGRAGRPDGQPQGHVRHGPWRQHHPPHA